MNYALIVLLALISCSSWSQTEVIPPPKPPETAPPPAPPQQGSYKVIDESAEFPGGMAALKKYLAENLVYPETAKEQDIQGRCYLRFIVTAEGKITQISIARKMTDCPECDQEAIRLVKGMPDWIPGKMNGKPVDSVFNLPITFKLD
jgi:protein TonB